MKPILAPTDFSDTSLNAVNYAADLCVATGADLVLLHICTIPPSYSEMLTSTTYIDDVVSAAERQFLLLKERLRRRTSEKINISSRVEVGEVVLQIEEVAADLQPYVVVMGAEKSNMFDRILFGGRTLAATKSLPFPLIVVPAGVSFHNIQEIGLACDFKNLGERIPLNEIRMIVKTLKASLHLLYVHETSPLAGNIEDVVEAEWLKELLSDLRPQLHFIQEHEIEKALIAFTQKNQLDLLIIIPKKHDLLGSLFQHSYSKHVVLQAPFPVMTIHE